MIAHFKPFLQRTLGVPFGENIMPQYIFADPTRPGNTSVEYSIEKRGERWWYERRVTITSPRSTDEIHSQWFGSYDSEEECLAKIKQAETMDTEFYSK